MIRFATISIAMWVAISPTVHARAYVPISAGAPNQSDMSPYVRKVSAEARPFVPGIRSVEVELLEDALRRKMPRTIGTSREQAHAKIIRNSLRDPMKRAHIKGIMAEALFLGKNPNWGYVRSPTASQHDVYTWVAGRKSPFTAQIKTHTASNPVVYAEDMIKDHRSVLFILPDDHVEPLKAHLNAQLRLQENGGRVSEAFETRRQLSRIRGLGFTSKELDQYYAKGARDAYREQYAGYISLGTATAMAVGPELWNLLQTGEAPPNTLLSLMHVLANVRVERSAYFFMSRNSASTSPTQQINRTATAKLGGGSLRGTPRGNALVGLALLITDTGFSVYQNGGRQAFRNESFYTNLGGEVSALTVGMLSGMPVAEAVTLMTSNPALGGAAGFGASLALGTVAYIGGKHVTRTVLEAAQPEFMLNREQSTIENAKNQIKDQLEKAKAG